MSPDVRHAVADRAKAGVRHLPRTAAQTITSVLRTVGGDRSRRDGDAAVDGTVEALLHEADEAARRAEEAQAEADDAAARARDAAARAQQAAEAVASQAAAAAGRVGWDREVVADDAGSALDQRTKAELLDLAADAGVEGRTAMTKAELVDALSARNGGTS